MDQLTGSSGYHLRFSRNNIALDEVISALEIVTQTFRKVRRAEFADGSRLNLAHSFACETERTAHFLERVILIRTDAIA